MKLLKFVNGDAPQTFAGGRISEEKLVFSHNTQTGGSSPGGAAPHNSNTSSSNSNRKSGVIKSWTLQSSPSGALHGEYWLLDDDNTPICPLNNIVLAVADGTTATPLGAHAKGGDSSSHLPRGVTEEDVAGVDLRSKLGQQLERTRGEYGTTYKTAARSARLMMNAEEVTEKKYERLKRERTMIAEALESGEGLVNGTAKAGKAANASSASKKRSKKQEAQ